MSSVRSCEHKTLGNSPINYILKFFSRLEIISCLFGITVLGFEGRFIVKFQGCHFVQTVSCSPPPHTFRLWVSSCSFVLYVTALVLWVR